MELRLEDWLRELFIARYGARSAEGAKIELPVNKAADATRVEVRGWNFQECSGSARDNEHVVRCRVLIIEINREREREEGRGV